MIQGHIQYKYQRCYNPELANQTDDKPASVQRTRAHSRIIIAIPLPMMTFICLLEETTTAIEMVILPPVVSFTI